MQGQISIHAPPRGATTIQRGSHGAGGDFNSRPSARGDKGRGFDVVFKPISIHAPPRGATVKVGSEGKRSVFQFTPLREGRLCGFSTTFALQISIHAPPRGATFLPLLFLLLPSPFQFTPLREGRRSSCCFLRSRQLFQFTPLREGRPRFSRFRNPHWNISIHAPPRGATGAEAEAPGMRGFQFTPLREGRPYENRKQVAENLFQFTPLREGRLTYQPETRWQMGFQFTLLREGRP